MVVVFFFFKLGGGGLLDCLISLTTHLVQADIISSLVKLSS